LAAYLRAAVEAAIVDERVLHVLWGGPHSSEPAAAAHLDQMRVALLWLSLCRQIGIRYPRTQDTIKERAEPLPIAPGSNLTSVLAPWEACDGEYSALTAVVVAPTRRPRTRRNSDNSRRSPSQSKTAH